MNEYYIGLLSGTSVDGVDAALVNFIHPELSLIATHFKPYPDELRKQILSLFETGNDEINRLGEIDILIAKEFAMTVAELIQKTGVSHDDILAIGSHGQTIRHHPHRKNPFTLQIGDPNVIAAETKITTVADFRRRDVALGGQGAPLVPAFHQSVFRDSKKDRVIVNIGGIANITVLPKNESQAVIGYDTGPGNALLDALAEKYLKTKHDENGKWAATGKVNEKLLNHLLEDPYFKLTFPKSTGREYFNLDWLEKHLHSTDIEANDIQRTLVELTAISIIESIKKHFSQCEIFICGGGIHNNFLLSRIKTLAAGYTVESTQTLGIDPDWVEAMAFAWLARQTMLKLPGNLPAVTGAKSASILGGVYLKDV